MFPGCSKSFLKMDGHFVHGKWFCTNDHAQNDPEVKKIIEMLAKLEVSKLNGGVAGGDGDQDDDDDDDVEIDL